MRPHTLHARLRAALTACKLSTDLTWYQCTRHTFASQWVMAERSIEKRAAVLGHSPTEVTRRYAHLRPDALREADRRALAIDLLAKPEGEVVPLAQGGANGQRMARGQIRADSERASFTREVQ